MLVAARRSAETVRAELTPLDEELESNPGTAKRPDPVVEIFRAVLAGIFAPRTSPIRSS
jgi:hypothetical protein